MKDYRIFRLNEKPSLLFYVPRSISRDYAVALYPGMGRPFSSYMRAARLFAKSGVVAAITEWHDGGFFSEEKMTEAVYRPADLLRNELNEKARFGHVAGIGHSFGAERLLKAALKDTENRFSAIVLVQPPDNLKKYIKNHPYMYHLSRAPVTRKIILRYIKVMERSLGIRTEKDQQNLLYFIDRDQSLAEMISADGNGKQTRQVVPPSCFLFSKSDTHVSYKDSVAANELLRKNGHFSEAEELHDLHGHISRDQMKEIFVYSSRFFEKVLGEKRV